MADYLKHIRTFIPNSAKAEMHPLVTLKGIERFPYALDELGQFSEEHIEESSVFGFNTEQQLAAVLKERFTFHRTDKVRHAYHLLYGQLLSRIGTQTEINLLEIGLGTVDQQLISHMPKNGCPGASLRAFRDVLPNAKIFGADIDRKTLFEEDRIQTAWVDQLDPQSFLLMDGAFGNPGYDLIIDDGLHSVSANLNTLLFGLTVLKAQGWIVIEDIGAHRICWNTVYRLLPSRLFNKYILKCKGPYVFLLQKKATE